MKAQNLFIPALLALAGLAGCASTEPQELVNAKSAFNEASNGPAAQLAPADLHAAQEQLAVAQRSFDKDGASDATRDLAYAAQRKAQLAEVRAKTLAEQAQVASAKGQMDQMKDQQVKLTSAELSAARQQLNAQGQQLATAEQEKADAERRAAQAAADLARIASVKQESRGMVITLSGGVLFQSAKYDLLPQAQSKLSEVSNVLTKQDPDSKIVVQGYTDSQGSASFNQELSQHRAESVRSYLVSHGISSDRITAQGFGPANPVADNASPEGRADNRRVEIVVQNKSGGPSSTSN